MRYRPEITGLRAIAVLPVILFHAGLPLFSGGYAGVDIFFVISGYLITSILLTEHERGTYSLANFYERRARRILPALFFIVICCLPLAWFTMLPEQLDSFFASVASVALFISNFHFLDESGYFETNAEEKPLLHTWSLAVEEQYYLLFPLLLMLLWRYRNHSILTVFIGLAALSLIISEIGWRLKPDANFYLLPSRLWELLAGSICAVILTKHSIKQNGLLTFCGLTAIAASFIIFNDLTPFPSLWTLIPVIGTCLIILFAGGTCLTSRILSIKPFIWIGLVSYSAYLWHQPLFAFARLYSLGTPSTMTMIVLALTALVLAALTWKFIEQPFRKKSAHTAAVLIFSAVMSLIILGVGLIGSSQDGFKNRLPDQVLSTLAAKHDTNPNKHKCDYAARATHHEIPQNLPVEGCIFGSHDSRPTVAILGDSHADAIASAIGEELGRKGITSTQITVHGCQPFQGYTREDMNCDLANAHIFDYLVSSNISTVILAARWGTLAFDNRFDNQEGGIEPGSFGRSELDMSLDELWSSGITRFTDAGKTVVLVYPIPEAGWNVPEHLAKRLWREGKEADSLSTSYDVYKQRNQPIFEIFDTLQHKKLIRVRPETVFCDGMIPDRCANAYNGDIYYYDDDHLSHIGAKLLAKEVSKAFD